MDVGRHLLRRFAETMLFWRGYLTLRDIEEFGGVSTRTASNLTSEWRSRGVLPVYKSHARRRLEPSERFEPDTEVTRPEFAFFSLLTADSVPGNPFSKVSLPGGGHDLSIVAPIPTRAIRHVVGACIDRKPVRVLYAAKSGRQQFVFSPVAIVRSRGRYHLRGYRADGRDIYRNRLEDRYVDVVPSRTIEVLSTHEAPYVGLEQDIDWHTIEEREFIVSRRLSENERICYEHEYGIAETGVLQVKERRALMPYIAQELSERQCWRPDGSCEPIWMEKDDAY